jgi:hypothetical protein
MSAGSTLKSNPASRRSFWRCGDPLARTNAALSEGFDTLAAESDSRLAI